MEPKELRLAEQLRRRRRMHRFALEFILPKSTLRLGVLVIGAVLVGGCHAAAPMRPLDIELQTPEKDILIYEIEIAEPTSPRGYRDWASEQLASLGTEPVNELYPGIPIYEVWYRFRLGRETIAEVAFRRDEGGNGPLVHAQTIVRALPSGSE